MTVSQNIPLFSSFPSFETPTSFANDMEGFVDQLQEFIDDVNTFGDEVNVVQAAIDTNVSLSQKAANVSWLLNYVGSWSSQTGSASVGVSVSHSSSYWILNTDLADITTKTPGTDSEWTEIKFPRAQGATSTSSGTDITLESSDTYEQIISPSADIKIALPPATELLKGLNFIISNTSTTYNLFITDSDGTYVKRLNPEETGLVCLTAKSSPAGTWAVYELAATEPLDFQGLVGAADIFEVANITPIYVAKLNSSKAIVAYGDVANSGAATACILNVSGHAITAGTPTVFDGACDYITITALSETKAFVVYQDSDNSNEKTAIILDISGNTITPGTPVTWGAVAINQLHACAMSATQAMVVYRDTANSNRGTACIFSVSGSTITVQTPAVIESVSTYYPRVARLTDTKAIVAYRNVSTGYSRSCVLSVSGTTITPGTAATFDTDRMDQYVSITPMSETQAIVVYPNLDDSYHGYAGVLDVSGTTITAQTPVEFLGSRTRYNSVTTLSSTQALVIFENDSDSNQGYACVLDVASSIVSPGTEYEYHAGTTHNNSIAGLAANKAILVYADGANFSYGTARVLY